MSKYSKHHKKGVGMYVESKQNIYFLNPLPNVHPSNYLSNSLPNLKHVFKHLCSSIKPAPARVVWRSILSFSLLKLYKHSHKAHNINQC